MQKLRQRLVLFAMVLAVVTPTLATTTSFAAGCASPSIMFGRWKWCGYWYSKFQDTGDPVRTGGVPGSVNTVQTFINMILGDLAGDAKHQTEAKFVIRTMLGPPYYSLPTPPQAAGSAKTPSNSGDPNVAIWENELRTYSNISENGSTSVGQNGSIDWFYSQHMPCGTYNTYWQPSYDDIAPYVQTTSNSTCGNPGDIEVFIVVRDTSGNPIYTIRRACMNPMGNMGHLSQTPLNNYTLTPTVTSSASTALAGDSVTFTYGENYSGSSTASNISCTIYANVHPGTISPNPPSPAETSGSNPGVSTGCPRSFSSSGTFATETVSNLPANSTVCRTLVLSPSNNGSGSAASEACVEVVNEPYVSVKGGDISAGSGFGNSCSESSAIIKSWNLNTSAAPNYYGAGSEIGAWATGSISNFVSGMGLTGGAAANSGYGLSFANTVNIGGGNYGGIFGTGSVPCMHDYYADRPTSGLADVQGGATTVTSLATVASGVYNGKTSGGVFTLGGVGAITVGKDTSGNVQNITVYVQGSVYIKSNIVYSYGNIADIPRLNLYVQGDIYIDPSVTQLHGVYMAQRNGAAGGTITTCAPGVTSAPQPYGTCNSQLTVVGAVGAETGVRLDRTYGNLITAPGVTNQPAEVFQYSPEMWMARPATSGSAYQAYTSLPPVL